MLEKVYAHQFASGDELQVLMEEVKAKYASAFCQGDKILAKGRSIFGVVVFVFPSTMQYIPYHIFIVLTSPKVNFS